MAEVSTGRLLVVGAGAMGAQIALQAAKNGVDVELVDISAEALDRGRSQIESILDRDVERGRATRGEADATLARLHLSGDIQSAAQRSDFAIEAVVERADVKRAVFDQLAEHLPEHAGIATNSSHIRVATIVEGAPYRHRALNMHFFHPVVVMDLVEIVASPDTEPAILEAATAWADRMKRQAVVLYKDVDGFLVNRILGQASREAFSLLADGVAKFEQIDIAVKNGLGWPMGPFMLADLSGLDVVFQTRTNRFEQHGEEGDRKTLEVLKPLVDAGRLGRKSGKGFYDYTVTPPAPLSLS